MFYLPRVAIPRIFSRPVCAAEGAIRDYVVEAAEHSRERSSRPSTALRPAQRRTAGTAVRVRQWPYRGTTSAGVTQLLRLGHHHDHVGLATIQPTTFRKA